MRVSILKSIELLRGLLLLGVSLSLSLWLDPHCADPTASKTFCFSVGALLLGGLTAMKFWWGGKISLPKGPIVWAGLVLFAAVLAAFIFSPSHARGEASFNAWLLVFLLVLSAFDWLQEPSHPRLLMIFFSLTLGLACVWGLLQALGLPLDAADLGARAVFGARVSSRLANPNFFGGFLLLTIPAALWLGLNSHKAWFSLLLLACVMVVLSGSKAVLAGLGFEYFALGHLQWRSSRPLEARQKSLRLWAGIGLIFASFSLGLMPAATRARLVSALNPKNESVQFRLQTWKGAVKAFAARPLLGHGPGSFAAVYPAFRSPAAMQSQMQHSYEVSHAENWPLQIAVEYGLLGLAALLAFLYFLGKPLWLAALSGRADSSLDVCLVLSLGGSLVGNLASLDLFLPSSFWFFALFAALALTRVVSKQSMGLNAETYAALLLSACIVLACLIGNLEAFGRFKSQRLLRVAEGKSQAGDFAAAIPIYDQALQCDPGNLEALYFMGASQLDSGQAEQALKSFQSLQALAPDYVLVHDKKARALKAAGKIEEAEAEWERQLELDPWYLPSIQDLAGSYAHAGRLADALRVLEKACTRFPERGDIKANLNRLLGAVNGRGK